MPAYTSRHIPSLLNASAVSIAKDWFARVAHERKFAEDKTIESHRADETLESTVGDPEQMRHMGTSGRYGIITLRRMGSAGAKVLCVDEADILRASLPLNPMRKTWLLGTVTNGMRFSRQPATWRDGRMSIRAAVPVE
jgi:hypothetical protein